MYRFSPLSINLVEYSYLAQMLVMYVQTTSENYRLIGEVQTTSQTKGYALLVDSLLKVKLKTRDIEQTELESTIDFKIL